MAIKIQYDFDPEEETGIVIPKSKRQEALGAVADFVRESVLSDCGDGRSPVAGGKWQRQLSPKYKKLKSEISGVDYANMELYGDMLDATEVVVTRNGLRMKVSDAQAPKADGHNNFSGKSKLPPREFVPNAKKGQRFRKEIVDGMRKILIEYEDES